MKHAIIRTGFVFLFCTLAFVRFRGGSSGLGLGLGCFRVLGLDLGFRVPGLDLNLHAKTQAHNSAPQAMALEFHVLPAIRALGRVSKPPYTMIFVQV